jgi:hypothetical protein
MKSKTAPLDKLISPNRKADLEFIIARDITKTCRYDVNHI